MNRRQFLKSIAFAAVSLSIGDQPTTLEIAIEKEIRKHDSWVEEWVQQDYNLPQGNQLGLRIIKESDKGLELGTSGYVPDHNLIYIMDCADVPLAEAIDGVDHELGHFVDGFVGRGKGLISAREYSGPGLEEISSYTSQRVLGKEFDSIKLLLRKKQYSIKIYEPEQVILGYVTNILKPVRDQLGFLQDIITKMKPFAGFLDEQYKAKAETLNSLEVQTDNVTKELREFMEWYKAVKEVPLEQKTFEELDGIVEKLEAIAQRFTSPEEARADRFSKYDNLPIDLDVFAGETYSAYEKAINTFFDREKNSDPNDTLMLEAKRKSALADLEGWALQYDKYMSSIMEEFSKRWDAQEAGGVNSRIAADVYGNSSEILARMVDSLYSLYYGPVKVSSFQLTEKDLEFLGNFRYKGKKMFAKGIEKYRLSLEMIKDEIAPEQVKKQLEYATEFTYKGRQYSWQESNFRIKGKIPLFNIKDAL
jgi:hypothetical protein